MILNNKHYFTISQFANLFKIHKKTLYYYDTINLFKPEYVSENGYRYYSHDQIYDFHVLLALKELNISLEDTKTYVNHRTPMKIINLYENKAKELEDEIQKLADLKDSINKRINLIKESLELPIETIEIKHKTKQYLRLNPIEVKGEYDTNYLTWHDVFSKDGKHQLNESAYGHMLLYENLIKHDFSPNYILVEAIEEEDIKNSFIKPEGNYLIGRKNGKVMQSATLYKKLVKYIDENNLEVVGNAYEFCIIDGSFASDFGDRVLEIQIQVK